MSEQPLSLSSNSSYGTERTQSTNTVKKLNILWTSSKVYNFFNRTFKLTNLVKVRLLCLNMQFECKCLQWNLKPYFNDDIHYEEQQTDQFYPFSDPTWNADPIATETNVRGQSQGGWVFKECQDVKHKYKHNAASGVKIKIQCSYRGVNIVVPEKSWLQFIVSIF